MLRRSREREARTSEVPKTKVPETCEHLEAAIDAAEPNPSTPGHCEDCKEDGKDAWAHLRMCLTCGHVGCCDSSPHQHASGHFEQTGHPVMRSVEPGENWRWCYIDARVG
ncbi:UBP-type zinc finger domain-containing protein [Mycobacterium neglectum]|uniref:UBP-type zinc finger domain-containing protein n=1 Tax=Mycobacterium neglectum TaxID=242737 RepID=UPI000BFEB877|nr:UBP-type zinc finger domain-containing protein [Mycobacterium neglectum]